MAEGCEVGGVAEQVVRRRDGRGRGMGRAGAGRKAGRGRRIEEGMGGWGDEDGASGEAGRRVAWMPCLEEMEQEGQRSEGGWRSQSQKRRGRRSPKLTICGRSNLIGPFAPKK